jgi:uncharacterized protein (TIGR02452 family)
VKNTVTNTDALIARAQETLAICEAGTYVTYSGRQVLIRGFLGPAIAGTVLHERAEVSPRARLMVARHRWTAIEVRNESTFMAAARLTAPGSRVAVLNFASAYNPGGGFLRGSTAQEEALARASGLYPCLLAAPDFYARNRANGSSLYLDLSLFSPGVPFFRDDYGTLLGSPILASVVTVPAPNARAIRANEPGSAPLVEPTLRRRAELVLATARVHGIDRLVLGAWGCGVFGNDPTTVASIFAGLLAPDGAYGGAFERVVFAVLDRAPGVPTYQAFTDVLGSGAQR